MNKYVPVFVHLFYNAFKYIFFFFSIRLLFVYVWFIIVFNYLEIFFSCFNYSTV